MKTKSVELYRRDFKDAQDWGAESLFNYILHQLGIPENKQNDIDEISLSVVDWEDLK
ncbi:MAG: hypothetical protein ACW98X_25980 [Promethearchaeota archaeon]|jgi:hypothetical protein